ncbi:hypothetical protein PHSY_002683 [Pseudozyma hubeiensis SY62]|uniref:Uncharacterized protein n=1 Tax=Pseudozyma hubeiensis (strain SY62) TaxID=1305764 RepID=R9P1D9_PSEHS|nr:hypothetical protein PHSY_002683 [Pseudozyma hubeiensis SY62]GAC95108.1 hypothetical protein PHSY_002683 [Pseudozyma hubeiensis SY62]
MGEFEIGEQPDTRSLNVVSTIQQTRTCPFDWMCGVWTREVSISVVTFVEFSEVKQAVATNQAIESMCCVETSAAKRCEPANVI